MDTLLYIIKLYKGNIKPINYYRLVFEDVRK